MQITDKSYTVPNLGAPPRSESSSAVDALLECLSPVQSLSPAQQSAQQSYLNDVAGGVGQLRELRLAELPPLVNRLTMGETLQAYGRTESIPVRSLLEDRLQELARQGTALFRSPAPSPETEESKKKKKSWVDDMHRQGGPTETDGPDPVEQLIKDLGLKPDSKEAGEVRTLSLKMWQCSRSRPKIHGYLRDIAKRHGVATLGKICEKLNAYLSAHWNDKARGAAIDEGELVECALRDVAHPTGIGQGGPQDGKNTCPASAIQCKTAAERPLQYIEMLTALASNQSYKLPDGSLLKPNNTWQGDAHDDRRLSEKIMQNALMDLRGRPYDSKKDNGGMSRPETESVIEKVFGYSDGDFDLDTPGRFTSKETLWAYVEDDLSRGRPVSVSFEGHSVMVIGYDPTSKPPNVLIATWGGVYTMALPDFLQNLQAVRSVDDDGRDNHKLPTDRKTVLVG